MKPEEVPGNVGCFGIALALLVAPFVALLTCSGCDDAPAPPDADTSCSCSDPAATRACIAWCSDADAGVDGGAP